jgi:4-hydroxysphinganine ceramide fatty acyl 2-hydroxylase
MVKPDEVKVFTKQDIQSLINDKKRAIVMFEGDVYDATDFKITHPGGPKFIDEHIGEDITESFYDEEHTKIALRLLSGLKIGTLTSSIDDQDSQNTTLDPDSRMREIDNEEWRNKVDPKKGTIYQVYKNLNQEEYMHFINDPKHLTRPDDDHRMFYYEFLDMFTRTPWYHVAIFWFPVMIWFLSKGIQQQSPLEVVLTFLFGIF